MNIIENPYKKGHGSFFAYLDRAPVGRPDLWINLQYETVTADNQDLLASVDTLALVSKCRALDLALEAAKAETAKTEAAIKAADKNGPCPKCGTWCFGDCRD